MSDLIRRQDAIYAIIDELMPSTPLSAVIRAKRRFKDLPAVQPERKQGRWIPVTYRYVPVKDDSLNTKIIWIDATEPDDIEGMKCSECGTVFDFTEARNWCSECGADMRGGESE